MDPMTGLGILLNVQQIIETIYKVVPSNTANFAKERDEMFQGWIVELKTALDDLLSRTSEMNTLVTQLVADPEFCRLQRNYGFEAAREAIDERRKFLAYAAAGTFRDDLSVAQLARVERIIRLLEPNDVRFLADVEQDIAARRKQLEADQRKLAGTSEYRQAQNADAIATATFNKVSSSASGQALLASGWLLMFTPPVYDASIEVQITHLGKEVLSVMQVYLLAASPQLSESVSAP